MCFLCYSTNLLKALPESIGNMKSLSTLNVCANQILRLPDSIYKLKSLMVLDVRYGGYYEYIDDVVCVYVGCFLIPAVFSCC